MRIITFLLVCIAVPSLLQAQNILAKKEFRSDKIKNVNIEGSFCDIMITKGPDVSLNGVIEGDGDEGDYKIETFVDGDELRIIVTAKSRNWKSRKITKSLLDLEIPANTALRIDNTSGDVRIEGLQADKYIIETTSGDVTVRRFEGQLDCVSTSGDQLFEAIVGDVDAESTSGNQDFVKVTGEIRFDVTSGDIDIRTALGSVLGESTSGDIEVDNLEGILEVQSTSGDIEVDNLLPTGDVSFRSSSGDIDVVFATSLENLSFDLNASSGDIEVGEKRSDGSLYIKQGTFVVRGKSTSGDQSYQD